MDLGASTPLRIWAVSDGRAGIEAQTVGLANAIAARRPADIVVKHVAYRGRTGKLPALLNLTPRRRLVDRQAISPPWPDLWIAAGRATLPLSMRVRRWSKGETFVVQLQDPRLPPRLFDFVIPPAHDGLSGDNVFPIIGSPNRVTPARLATDLEIFRYSLAPYPAPKVAVLVGGKSRAFDLSPARAEEMAGLIEGAVQGLGGSVLATFSRRTPAQAREILTARLRRLPGWIWNDEGANPLFAFLAAADFILVTEDSTNMAVEAASTGKPVYVLKMDGRSAKFDLFHRQLRDRGAARPFAGELQAFAYAPLDETGRAADEVLRRLERRGAGQNRR